MASARGETARRSANTKRAAERVGQRHAYAKADRRRDEVLRAHSDQQKQASRSRSRGRSR